MLRGVRSPSMIPAMIPAMIPSSEPLRAAVAHRSSPSPASADQCVGAGWSAWVLEVGPSHAHWEYTGGVLTGFLRGRSTVFTHAARPLEPEG